jgi:6-phosphofructokinase 1
MAIEALSEGQRNVMIGIKNGELVYVPIKRAISHSTHVDLRGLDIVRILSM